MNRAFNLSTMYVSRYQYGSGKRQNAENGPDTRAGARSPALTRRKSGPAARLRVSCLSLSLLPTRSAQIQNLLSRNDPRGSLLRTTPAFHASPNGKHPSRRARAVRCSPSTGGACAPCCCSSTTLRATRFEAPQMEDMATTPPRSLESTSLNRDTSSHCIPLISPDLEAVSVSIKSARVPSPSRCFSSSHHLCASFSWRAGWFLLFADVFEGRSADKLPVHTAGLGLSLIFLTMA